MSIIILCLLLLNLQLSSADFDHLEEHYIPTDREFEEVKNCNEVVRACLGIWPVATNGWTVDKNQWSVCCFWTAYERCLKSKQFANCPLRAINTISKMNGFDQACYNYTYWSAKCVVTNQWPSILLFMVFAIPVIAFAYCYIKYIKAKMKKTRSVVILQGNRRPFL